MKSGSANGVDSTHTHVDHSILDAHSALFATSPEGAGHSKSSSSVSNAFVDHSIHDARRPLLATPPEGAGRTQSSRSVVNALADCVIDPALCGQTSSSAPSSLPSHAVSDEPAAKHNDVEAGVRSSSSLPQVTHPRRMDSLEDLTERLVHAGMYEEYVRWRDGYARWRMGSARGARGELVQRATAPEPDSVDNWNSSNNVDALFRQIYPTFRSFMFKRTLAYWVGVSFIEGSALFVIACGFQCIQGTHDVFATALTVWPSVIGGSWFLIGSYLGYVQQINWELGPKTAGGSIRYFVAPWNLPLTFGTTGWQSYLFGAIMFTVAQIMSFVRWSTVWEEQVWVYVPMSAGGVCFVLAGVCEVLENAEERGSLVWWASWANFSGSVLFLIGSALPMVNPHSRQLLLWGSSWPFLVGCILFVVASVCSLFLWTNDMFGLTLSRKLNKVSTQHLRPLSSNTITSNVIYILAAAVASANFCLAVHGSRRESKVAQMSQAINSCLLCILVHLLLILTSAITILPKEQPYRALMLAVRFLSGFLVLDVVSTFVSITWYS